MEPSSSRNTPSDLNGLSRRGYGGAITAQHQRQTGTKKSRVRLNDQRMPKPTDINIQENVIKIVTPKKHPYSSHISQFAMFPSFRSPDDPQTGVRAASQPFLSPLIPNGAADVTLLSKTMGNPYRHEVVEAKTSKEKKALNWPGEHGVLDHTKSLKGSSQLSHHIPPKKVPPSSKLRDWDSSLSERTYNILKNMERTHWVTSYQMHYTGSVPDNPLKMDNLWEKMSDLTGMNSHSAPLREAYFPAFVPSKLRRACSIGQGSHVGESICSPTAPEPWNLSPAANQGPASARGIQYRPEDITAEHIDAIEPDSRGHGQLQSSFGSSEAQGSEWSREVLYKQDKSFPHDGGKRENYKVHFVESPIQVSLSQSSKEADASWTAATEQALDTASRPVSQREMEAHEEESVTEQDETRCKKEYSEGGRNVPTRPALPGIRSVDKMEAVGREDAALSLLGLQNSFSKSMAHRNFNSSIAHATMNLRDNVVSGKKHNFYGINCYYLRG